MVLIKLDTYMQEAPELVARPYGFARSVAGRKPHPSTNVQLVRSLIVSCIALVCDFSLLVIFKEVFGINYLVAATMSFLVGVMVNYVFSIYWVFPERKLANRNAELLIFVVICTFGLLLNLLIIAVLVEHLRVDYRIAKLVSTIVVFFWNFVARKKILY